MGTTKLAAQIAIGFSLVLALSGTASAENKISDFDTDDGTYSVMDVTSPQECEALCKADAETCRGTVIYQPDVTKSDMRCRLNNGFGSNAVFPRIAPEPVDFETALADLNRYRIKNGLGELRYNEKLNRASEVHAEDLAQAGIISHSGTDGSTHGDRVQLQGYQFAIAGENVATGQKSWKDVFRAWQKSPGHNENLLRPDVSEFGLALVYEPTTTYSTYWAMLVAEPLSSTYTVDAK